jgi:hypothetical protein
MHKHTEASVKMGEDLSNFVNIERSIKHPNIYCLFVLTYLLVNDLTIENTV